MNLLAPMARRTRARLTKEQRRVVQQLWRKYPRVMSPLGLISLDFNFKKRITSRRLDKVVAAIMAWISEHKAPPDDLAQLKLEEPLNFDGYGLPLKYLKGEGA